MSKAIVSFSDTFGCYNVSLPKGRISYYDINESTTPRCHQAAALGGAATNSSESDDKWSSPWAL